MQSSQDAQNRSHGLQTVQEGNETNQMTTGEKGMFLNSQGSGQPISKETSGHHLPSLSGQQPKMEIPHQKLDNNLPSISG